MSSDNQGNSDKFRTLALLLASTMTVMAGATLAPALPGMQLAFSELPQSEFWVKMSMALPGLVIALCAPFVGQLLDNSRKKAILVVALFVYAATGVAGYFWPDSIWLILASRAMLGVAVACIMVGCTTLAGYYFKGPDLARYMGLQAAFGGFGGVVFLALAGVLADQNWHFVFCIYLLALVITPFVMLFVTEPQKPASAPAGAPKQSAASAPRRSLMSCYLLAGCEILVLYTVVLHLPFLLVSENQISASETGFILSLFLLMMSLVSMFYGKVSGKLSIPAIHLLGWLAIGTGLVLLGLGQSLTVLVLSLVLAGVGLGLIRPNLIIWLFSFTPLPQRGKVIGGITTCFFVGQFVSPLVTEPVVQFFGKESGYSMLFLLMGSVALGVTFILAIRYLLTQKSSDTADNL